MSSEQQRLFVGESVLPRVKVLPLTTIHNVTAVKAVAVCVGCTLNAALAVPHLCLQASAL
jgi:hypothetical protein